jgi:Na+/proline symporter
MLNLDTLIFSTFLIINILVGLFHSRGVVNIQQYAIGERNFSTSTLVATIVATWLGVEFLNYDLSETYSHGLYFMLPSFGDAISIFLVGAFFAKRMGEFLGKLSIAEAMGDLFGRRVQFITAVMGVFLSIGYLAIQFKMSAKVLEMLFGSSAIYSTLISAIIVVVYSTLGGIRSVAFTDVIQLLTFGLIIPIIVITVWHKSDASVVHTFQTNSNFDFKEIFDLTNPRFYEMLILAGFFFTPSFQPAMFQRISMASSTQQAAQSFRISSFVCLIIKLLVMFLGVVILSENPNLDPEKLMNYVTNHYTYIGFKGLFATAIMAVVMSTADSLINTIGVIFANDLLKPSGLKFMGSELKTSKIFAFTSAMIAILFALKFHSILELILMFAGSYMAIVSIPFILAILGFRSSETSVLIAMTGAATTFIIWQNKLFGITSNIDSCGPAIIASIIFLFAGHYLLRQPGGWTGIKDKIGFENHKKMQQKKRQEFINSIFGFSFNEFFQKNLPLNENTYPLIGFTSAGIIITNILFVPLHVHENNSKMLVIISGITWTIASYFAIFPILPESFKKHKIAAFLWTFGVTIAFVCSPFIFLILSDFEAIQSIILAINIIAVLFLFNWSVSLFLIALGTYSSSLLLQDYLVMEHDLQILITIAFLMLGLILATFAQPKEKAYKSKEKLYNKLDIEKADMSQKYKN